MKVSSCVVEMAILERCFERPSLRWKHQLAFQIEAHLLHSSSAQEWLEQQ